MKSYAICEVKSLDSELGSNPNGSFEAILSAATLDRDGEIIDAKAFEPLPDRIPIDIDHGMTVATTVGSGVPFYDGDLLKIKATFSSIPRAQEIRTLVTEGHIDRMSVTFMGAERNQKDGVPHVEKAELLNAAFVPIPSNREAAVLVAKAFAPTEGEKAAAVDLDTRVTQLEEQVKSLLNTQTPEPAAAVNIDYDRLALLDAASGAVAATKAAAEAAAVSVAQEQASRTEGVARLRQEIAAAQAATVL